MTTEKQAVKALADAIAKATKVMIEDNNKRYVNNQIKNFSGGGSVSGGGGGGGASGPIPASQVTGLYNTVAGYIINAKTNADGGDPIAGRILTTLNGIADIQVGRATINSAQISDLKAGVANIIHLTTQSATIEDATIRQLKADISNVGLANIGTADIGFAQVKDLVAGTAIIREGAASKLYIDRLAVTDANIVSLAAGEIMLKDTNNNFVRLVVDGTTGEITTETVTFDGDDVLNSNSLNANKIIEHSITARELNVASIFADSALIGAITADNIDVSTLFANSTFLQSIYTNTIQAASAGTDIDISQNSSVTLLTNKIGLVVQDSSTSASVLLTPGMIQAVGNVVDVKADTIDLSANQSVDLKVKYEIEESVFYKYKLDLLSTDDRFTENISSITLSPRVYKGSSEITNSTSASSFAWKRISADTTGDLLWNGSHSGVKTITIQPSDVPNNAIFQCGYTIDGVVMAFSSREIVDTTEGQVLDVFIENNKPNIQLHDVDNSTYAPDWSTSNLILTPRVFLNNTIVENTASTLTLTWKRLVNGSETELVSGESVDNNNRLVVNQNVLGNEPSGQITYIVRAACAVYNDNEDSVVSTSSEITISLKQLSGEDDSISLLTFTPSGNIFIGNTTTLSIQASIYSGASPVSTGVTYQWQRYNSGSWANIYGANSSVYSVSKSSVVGSELFRCVATYSGETYYSTIALCDSTDEYQAAISSSAGSILQNSSSNTTLKCMIFDNGEEIDSSGSFYNCWWYKLNKNGEPEDWSNGDFRKAGKTVVVDANEIAEKAILICEVIDQTVDPSEGLITRTSFTVVDISDVIQSDTAPVPPIEDMHWLDTGVIPNEMKRWNGEAWIGINEINNSALDMRLTNIEADISIQEGEIALRATKTEVNELSTSVSTQIAEIDAMYDAIALTVAEKSTNYRQETQPEDAEVGDIWVVPSTGKQYQAVENSTTGEVNWVEVVSQDFTQLVLTVNGISSTVTNLSGDVTRIDTQAGKIDWIIASGTSAANMQLTSDALSTIADNINLHGNNTVYISSDDQISATARGNMDLSANESIVIYSGDQITAEAASEIDLTSNDTIRLQSEAIELISVRVSEAESDLDTVNNSIVAIVEVTDNVSNWFTFGQDGLVIQKTNSKWSTRISDNGYYIDNEDVGHVEAFYKEEAHFRSIKVTKKAGQQSTDIRVRPTSTGGWVWSD